jgi:hypothetical protein
MLYDNALDDGPILFDDPPCLTIVNNSWEDKNDKLGACDVTLINESPILFLNSSNHTIEEKYAYVDKYLYGLQLSHAYENPCCSHDIKIDKYN